MSGAPRRPFPVFDVLAGALAAAGVVAVAFVGRIYGPPPVPFFPRTPDEFKTGAPLDADELTARTALRALPENIEAMVDLGIVLYQRGPDRYLNKDAALDAPWDMGALQLLERARHLGSLDERTFFYLASMYEAKGLPTDAADNYERHLRLHTDDVETRLRLGNLYYRLEDFDKSAAAYRGVLASRPGDPLVSYNLALVLRDKKSWTDGLEALRPFTQNARPLPSGGHKLLGDLWRGAGNPTAAVENYGKEMEASGESVELLAALAQAREDLKENDAAIAAWERVLVLDKDHRDARSRLRRLKKPSRR
ncbi:MAG: tetratricopeptide repeat protein [Elusimicrobia bacterium]|nr:tetratricopeptide repeat protein [Elusimicrobiota bacterium]MBK7207096.1 tetratricopeptide repeat protein [Elusimicrobiota bacterium]MBK7545902.1 tetratricopeptide repeat protein [Elusimicrobiota bacterium]MBK7574778.1 tetratricopeptide repeat protein [Elusimicrobiota bacterium]MBK7687570.1 tetratricopeptide repeat protein [Elusimicrobiota bacterium]